MLLSAETLRLLLVVTALGMAFIAAFYLRSRSLTLAQYLGWGLVMILVPFIGPFLTILSHPGRPAR
jgi:hypothetical protein